MRGAGTGAERSVAWGTTAFGPWLVPVGLFLVATLVRLFAAAQLPFPATEPSAYYVGVAQNLLAGEGLVSDAVWSYATPPLVVPKPAFELWLPMSSLVSALFMGLLGPSFWAAQVGGALMGAAVAPLTWAVAREAAATQGLDRRRGGAVALASGLLSVVLAPLLLASVVPDSYTPYLVATLLAVLLIPRVLGVAPGQEPARRSAPSVAAGLGLGLALGLAYLSRQEVIWLGLTVVLMLGVLLRGDARRSRAREAAARLWPVFVGGLVLVLPWLLRNLSVFGSPFPGQAVENAFLVRNEDIFAFADRPDLATYLGQGLATVLGNPAAAAGHALLDVILLPAFPVGLAGLLALWGLRHAPAVRRPTALQALLLSGAMTFVATMLLFPVASRWGTFAHASGPLLVGLTVTAALGADALLARVSRLRRWDRPNVTIGPIALLSVTALLALLQVDLFAQQSRATESRMEGVARALERYAADQGGELPGTIITDHPMWLARTLGRAAVALPDEDLPAVVQLSRTFQAPWVAVIDARGRYPSGLLAPEADRCVAGDPVPLSGEGTGPWLFVLDETCGQT